MFKFDREIFLRILLAGGVAVLLIVNTYALRQVLDSNKCCNLYYLEGYAVYEMTNLSGEVYRDTTIIRPNVPYLSYELIESVKKDEEQQFWDNDWEDMKPVEICLEILNYGN